MTWGTDMACSDLINSSGFHFTVNVLVYHFIVNNAENAAAGIVPYTYCIVS